LSCDISELRIPSLRGRSPEVTPLGALVLRKATLLKAHFAIAGDFVVIRRNAMGLAE
jgi:hypothetical protein